MKGFFKIKTPDEVLEQIRGFSPVGEEALHIQEAPFRVLAQEIIAKQPLPPFPRSTMDGYAVRSRDTFGASESQPALFRVVGEVVMGEETLLKVNPGEAAGISTGGMLPEGADAVVMIEYTQQVDPETIEISKAVAPSENMVETGEDVEKGDLLLRKGHRLRPQDLAMMAGLGISKIKAYVRPLVSIVSTGDELVEIERTPVSGQIRDINRYSLHGLTLEARGLPLFLGISKDRYEDLARLCHEGLKKSHCLLISGGSSVGARDHTLKVIENMEGSEILVHGISISPGKPTIIARVGEKAIVGLPGHPVSAMVVFRVFLKPLIEVMSGVDSGAERWTKGIKARVSRNLASAQGREDYVRVRIERSEDGLLAHPVLGKSGLISTMVNADGLISIGMHVEGLEKGEEVEVVLF